MNSQLKKIMDNAENIVFFGGAGVSTESNIPDFRGSEGPVSYTHLKDHRPVSRDPFRDPDHGAGRCDQAGIGNVDRSERFLLPADRRNDSFLCPSDRTGDRRDRPRSGRSQRGDGTDTAADHDPVSYTHLIERLACRTIFVADAHPPKTREFQSYPQHCVIGSGEDEVVDELTPYIHQLMRKNRCV